MVFVGILQADDSNSMTFDGRGNPMPYDIIQLTLAEVEASFSGIAESNLLRQLLFTNYKRYNNDLRGVLGVDFQQWLGGSFISKEADPSDVDVVNLIPYSDALNERLDELRPFFLVGGSNDTYRVDGHLIPVYNETDPRSTNTIERLAYFRHWFGHDRADHPKGIVEVTVIL